MKRFHRPALVAAVNRSKRYIDHKEYQQTIEVCDEAIARYARTRALDQELAIIYNNRGIAFFCLKDYGKALLDYNRALELRPGYFLTHRNRINLHIARKEELLALQATELLVGLLFRESDKQSAWGRTFFELKDYRRALPHFQKAIEYNSHDPEHYYWAGATFYATRDYSLALPYFLQTLNLDGRISLYHSAAGLNYLCLKDYPKAMRHIVQALKLDKTNLAACHNLGCVLLHLNHIREGRKQLHKALEMAPRHLCTVWTIEWSNLCFDPFDPAIVARFERAAEIVDYQSEAINELCRGVACWLQQRYDQALAYSELALTKEPYAEDAHFWKGMALAALGRDEEARNALEFARESEVPFCLFQTLKLLKPENEAFYQQYALPLLGEEGLEEQS